MLHQVSTTDAPAQFQTGLRPAELVESDRNEFDSVETNMNAALWTAGALRLDPWIGIRDAGFVDSLRLRVDEGGTQTPESLFDFRVVAGAGLRGYVPFGSHVILSANALQEYNWWASGDRRNLDTFSWAGGLFVQGNRADLELKSSSRERQDFATSEVEILSLNQTDENRAQFQIRMVRSLHLFARGADASRRYSPLEGEAEEPVRGLDRDDTTWTAGLRMDLGGYIDIGLGYQESDVDFVDGSRSHIATGPVLEFDYRGPSFNYRMDLLAGDVEPKPGAVMEPFDGLFGQFNVDFAPQRRLDISLFGQNFANYNSTSPGFSHYLFTRLGLRFGIPIGTRVRTDLFIAVGENDYEPTADNTETTRTDDVFSWGIGVSVPFHEYLSLNLRYRSEDFSSDFPGADRTRTSVGIGIGIGLSSAGNLDWASWP
ncbi:MAG: hypothetical protein R3190_00205 [Thermoanaerobaculia bacterium]|nr:hypothetical protein [Thermoanaerobaculia bacterium]